MPVGSPDPVIGQQDAWVESLSTRASVVVSASPSEEVPTPAHGAAYRAEHPQDSPNN